MIDLENDQANVREGQEHSTQPVVTGGTCSSGESV